MARMALVQALQLEGFLMATTMVSMVMTQIPCPDKCTCTGAEAKCESLHNTGLKFPDHVTNVTITKSSDLDLDGDTFGKYTVEVKVTETLVASIKPWAFSHTTALRSVHFRGCQINSVHGYAFSHISAPAKIVFDSTDVNFESAAFSELEHLSQIKFVNSVVSHFKPYSFFVVQSKEFSIHDTHIDKIQPRAFYSISEVQDFEIVNATVKTIENNAFADIKGVRRVTIKGSSFTDIHCASLMNLYFGKTDSSSTFSFQTSMVRCSCDAVPLVNFLRSTPQAAAETVTCAQSSSQSEQKVPLLMASTAKICPSGKVPACDATNPAFPDYPEVSSSRVSTTTPSTLEEKSSTTGVGGSTQPQGQTDGGNSGSVLSAGVVSWFSVVVLVAARLGLLSVPTLTWI